MQPRVLVSKPEPAGALRHGDTAACLKLTPLWCNPFRKDCTPAVYRASKHGTQQKEDDVLGSHASPPSVRPERFPQSGPEGALPGAALHRLRHTEPTRSSGGVVTCGGGPGWF